MAKKEHLKNAFMHFEKYDNFDNCYANGDALNLLKKTNSVVSRYMPYYRFKKDVSESKLTFLSPEKWTDPFEKIYLHTKFYGISEGDVYEPSPIACLCLTTQQFRNSVAFWKCFKTDMNQQLVRVEFYLKNVVEQICSLLKNVNVYVSVMNYKLDANTIKSGCDFIRKITENIGEHTNLEELYIKSLSYKRSSFEYEREISFFLIPQNREGLSIDGNGVFCLKNFDYVRAVKKIWVEPHPPEWILLDKAREELKFLAPKVSKSILYKLQEPYNEIKLKDEVVVAVINWNMTDEMNSDNVAGYVAEAFREYKNNPVTWNRHPKYIHGDERVKQRHLKSLISKTTHIWIIDYNSDASLPLDGLITDYYIIKKDKTENFSLVKSKANAPCSVECLDPTKLPSSVDDDPITFMLLENLIWN